MHTNKKSKGCSAERAARWREAHPGHVPNRVFAFTVARFRYEPRRVKGRIYDRRGKR